MKEESNRGTRRTREETGRPGAGKGRREEVRGSGIYPASGPLPPGRARVKTPASMGRHGTVTRSVGAAGVAARKTTSGELITAVSANAMPKQVAARKSLAQFAQQAPREIPLSQWQSFLDDFSIQREGWLTEVEVFEPDEPAHFVARGLPLGGISVDLDPHAGPTAIIVLGKEPGEHITHMIATMRRITLRNEAELGIESG